MPPERESATRILVTGASGFLGGYLTRDLLQHGFAVFASGRNRDILNRLVDDSHVVQGDLAHLAGLRLPVDTVIHGAALSTPWGPWRDFAAANVDGTASVIEFARRNGVRRVVHISSPSVYAAARDRLGIREHEVDSRRPLTSYIRSKLLAERILQAAVADGSIPELVIVRPRGLIGIGDTSLLPRMIEVERRAGIPLARNGANLIDITAVENVATALRLAITEGNGAGGVYNISNGDPRPFRALVEQLYAILGRTPRFRHLHRNVGYSLAAAAETVARLLPGQPEPPLIRYTYTTVSYSQTLDISRARRELGYHPEVTLDEALDRVGSHLATVYG